jgi:hypothetical protein
MMRFRTQNAANRREFFRGAARYVFAVLLTIGAGLVSRRAGQRCIGQGICRGCGVFDTCGLPQALSAKQFKASQKG